MVTSCFMTGFLIEASWLVHSHSKQVKLIGRRWVPAAADDFISSCQHYRSFCGVPAESSCHKVILSIVAPTRPTMWKHVSNVTLMVRLTLLPFLWKKRNPASMTVTTMTTREQNPWRSEGWVWCLLMLAVIISPRLLLWYCAWSVSHVMVVGAQTGDWLCSASFSVPSLYPAAPRGLFFPFSFFCS